MLSCKEKIVPVLVREEVSLFKFKPSLKKKSEIFGPCLPRRKDLLENVEYSGDTELRQKRKPDVKKSHQRELQRLCSKSLGQGQAITKFQK